MNQTPVSRLQDRVRAVGRSRFVRDVATVATGIAAAQAISMAFMPFLTRLYDPQAFGELAAFGAVVGIITPLATLGYANAIVMPETEEDATAVARLSLLCAAVIAPITLLMVFLFQSQLARWTGLEAAPGFLYLIPVTLLLSALLSVANQTAIREGLFRAKAGSYVGSKLLDNVSKLLGGVIAPSGLMLIVLLLVSELVNYLMLLRLVPRKGAFLVRRWFGTRHIRKAAREQRDFALYRMPQSVINTAAMGLPVILLTSFFGTSTAGQYSLTLLVLGAPVMLLGQSVGEVFYPKITRAILDGTEDAKALLTKATLVLFLLAVPLFGFVIITGPYLFQFVFGSEWLSAGRYAQWIGLWSIGMLACGPSVQAFPALNLQHYLLAQEILSIIFRIVALYVGFSYFQSDLIAIALFSLVGVVLTAAFCIIAFISIDRRHARSS